MSVVDEDLEPWDVPFLSCKNQCMKIVAKCYTYIDEPFLSYSQRMRLLLVANMYKNLNNSHLEPDHLLVFKIKINMAIETFSVMSFVVLGNHHEVVAVRVLQVTGEG